MARLVDLGEPANWPSTLAVSVGDVIALGASGAQIPPAVDAVEVLGPFVPAVLSDTGEVLAPMGAPSTVLLVARLPGRVIVKLFIGDPWHGSRSSTIEIAVTA